MNTINITWKKLEVVQYTLEAVNVANDHVVRKNCTEGISDKAVSCSFNDLHHESLYLVRVIARNAAGSEEAKVYVHTEAKVDSPGWLVILLCLRQHFHISIYKLAACVNLMTNDHYLTNYALYVCVYVFMYVCMYV